MAAPESIQRTNGGFPSAERISMPLDHFRWLLMWHTVFVREAMLLEIDIHGLDRARRNTRKLDRQRRAFIAEHWPKMSPASKT